jgi:tetratricopeptide (TPR) repeat protein
MNEDRGDVDFWLSGQLRIRRRGEIESLGPTRLNEVFALLLLRANTAVSVTEIISSLWPTPGQTNEAAVRSYVSRIRGLLAGTRCEVERQLGRYVLKVEPIRIDVMRFNLLVEQADRESDTRRRELLDEALRVCPNDALLTGFTRAWAHIARQEHQAKWRAAALRRNRHWLDAGEHERLVETLRREQAHRSLDQRLGEDYLVALYRSGNATEAMAHYSELTQRLTKAKSAIAARLRRLGEQIERQDPALDAMASGGEAGPDRPDMLPPFTVPVEGRQAEIRSIDKHAASREAVRIVGIYGAPGIGKTSLAAAYAQRNKAQYAGGVLFAHCAHARPTGGPDIDDVLARFLQALGVSGENLPAERGARLARYQDLVRHRRMLVVLDDVGSTDDVVQLLPSAPGSLVLVTSRLRLTALTARYGALAVVLGPLGQSASIAVLDRLAGNRPDWGRSAAAEIARDCGGHPLALCLAGARLATRPEEKLASLAGALAERGHRIAALDEYAEANEAVADVIGWSYRALPEPHARVFRLLGLSVCQSLDIPAVARLTELEEEEVRPVMTDLATAHLVTVLSEARYGMLDLIAEFAGATTAHLDSEEERTAAVDRLYDHYRDAARSAAHALWPLEVPPGPDRYAFEDPTAARAWLDAHRDDLAAVIRLGGAATRPAHVIDLANSLSRYLDHGGQLDLAAVLQREAADAALRLGDEPAAGRALSRLGAVLVRWGQFERAESVLLEAYDLCVRLGDAEGQATAMGNLGRVASRRGAYADGVAYQTRALRLFQNLGDRLAQARTLTNLGIVHKQRGAFTEALRCLEEARVICGELSARDAAARVAGTIGGILHAQGQLDEAQRQYQEAMDSFRDLGDRVGEATVLAYLGQVSSDQGRHASAIELHEESLAIFNEVGDEGGYIDTLLYLGSAMLVAGRHSSAVTMHTEALERARHLGVHGQVARAHACLAEDHAVRSRRGGTDADAALAQAREHLAEALSRFGELGVEPPASLITLSEQVALT